MKSKIIEFEKQVTYSKIWISINIYTFISNRNIFENHAIWHIYKYITNTRMIPKEMTIVTIIIDMVMHKYHWWVNESPDYMAVIRMMVIMPVIPV
jgi:hypothetical protein